MRARINSHDEKNDKAEDLRFLQSVEPATPIPSNPVNLERTNARRFLSLSLPFFLSQLGRRTKLLVRWPSAGISLVGGNQEAGRKKNRAKKKKKRKRERESRVDCKVPIASSRKNGPHGENVAHYAREGASFFAGYPERLAEGGRRLNVDESRAAGKPSCSPLEARRRGSKEMGTEFNDYWDESLGNVLFGYRFG